MAAGRTGTAAALCGPVVAVVLAAGCGTAPGGGSRGEPVAPADTRPRMERVAAAWEGSAALAQWREGFHPLDEQDWAPAGGFRSGEDKAAAVNGNFVLRAALPEGPPSATPVRWDAGGAELTLPLLTAREAYGQLQGGAKGGEARPDHVLSVTAIAFGETTVRTSRGPARVPAWSFTVEGYDTPLTRIAIRPQELPKPPIEPLRTFDGGTAPLFGRSAAPPDVTSFEVTAGHGACDGGVAVDVLEGTDTVVLAGRILPGGKAGRDGACPALMLQQRVPVTLARPVGERLVLDSESGAPLEQGPRRR
ncbi:hypothetical protein ACFV9E_33055 [Streptomyces sp. NPDC059835]|uniref:hypothetical protein n=1 Tax=Streptomyces sp. NPDC059835 TaxID=3346967 RepID=UPI00365BDE07